MVKVVVNKCYGGFGLSSKAQKEYLKLIGKEAYFYKQTKYKHNDGVEEHTRVPIEEDGLFIHTLTKDFGETFGEYGKEHFEYFFSDSDIERDDPNLVLVVEKLGEEASGQCSNLDIVEIPDDISWEIDEYDGMEQIAEEHRTWS